MLSFSTITQPSDVDRRNRTGDSENYHRGDRVHVDTHAAEGGGADTQALTDLMGLLETRISIDDEDRQKTEKNAKIKRGWMMAAAVIDCLCFIALIIIFTVGTVVFALLLILS